MKSAAPTKPTKARQHAWTFLCLVACALTPLACAVDAGDDACAPEEEVDSAAYNASNPVWVADANSSHVYGDLRLSRVTATTSSLTGFVCANTQVVGTSSAPEFKYRLTSGSSPMVKNYLELSSAERNAYKVIGQYCQPNDRLFLISEVYSKSTSQVSDVYVRGRNGGNYTFTLDKNASHGGQKYGIVYSLDHCPYSGTSAALSGPTGPFDVTAILAQPASSRVWGPLLWDHWVSEPVAGYYCVAVQPEVARKHAYLLSIMGIDFIVADMTNTPKAYTSGTQKETVFSRKIAEPLEGLVDEWNELAIGTDGRPMAVPKIVPWAAVRTSYKGSPVTKSESLVQYLENEFLPSLHSNLEMQVDGKPLLLVKMNANPNYDPIVIEQAIEDFNVEDTFTYRAMWGKSETLADKFGPSREAILGLGSTFWSFLEPCRTNSSGTILDGGRCQQPSSNEQISVSVGYTMDVMSLESKTHQRNGRTLYQQFLKVFADDGDTPYVVLTAWNTWTNPRQCPDDGDQSIFGYSSTPLTWGNYSTYESRACENTDFYSNGAPMFMDNYTMERSKIVEPDVDRGDCYMSLARELIFAAKGNASGLSAAKKAKFDVCNFVLVK